MTVIAWAIVVAACLMMPERDNTRKYYEANNTFDCIVFFFAFGMFLWQTFK
jgi:hypothetical protein